MSLCSFLNDGNSVAVPFRLLLPRQLASETALSDGLETDENVLAIVEVAGSMGECWVSKGLVSTSLPALQPHFS